MRRAEFSERQAEAVVKILEQYAETQAETLNKQIEIIQTQRVEIDALKAKEPATKQDIIGVKHDITEVKKNIDVIKFELIAKIEQYRYGSLKFTVWTGVGVVLAMAGMLAKGFHWF